MKYMKLGFVSVLLCAVLAGCGGTVTRPDGAASVATPLAKAQTRKATVQISDEAKPKIAENLRFSDAELVTMINRRLDLAGAISETAEYSVLVTVTDVRVRSTFSAVMWGFMAGDDHITGTVELFNAERKPVHKFTVNASYALGGLAGGQDSSRMGWLYDKFSELVVIELRGQTPAAAASQGGAMTASESAPGSK